MRRDNYLPIDFDSLLPMPLSPSKHETKAHEGRKAVSGFRRRIWRDDNNICRALFGRKPSGWASHYFLPYLTVRRCCSLNTAPVKDGWRRTKGPIIIIIVVKQWCGGSKVSEAYSSSRCYQKRSEQGYLGGACLRPVLS